MDISKYGLIYHLVNKNEKEIKLILENLIIKS